jgi:Tfp pilus assembly protein PilV
MSRNSWALIAAVLAVVAIVALGFWILGSPAHERQVHQDMRTVQALCTLAQQIDSNWRSSNKVLPANLSRFPASSSQDPTTNAPFIYRLKAGSEYELCATFLTDDLHERQNEDSYWLHPKGPHCFPLDASTSPPLPPYPASF